MAGRKARLPVGPAVYCPGCGDVRGHASFKGSEPETRIRPDGKVWVRGHFRAYMTPLQSFCQGGFADPVADLAP